jgi:VWFA-related protein
MLLLAAAGASVVAGEASSGGASPRLQASVRSVYVTVTDPNGAPVTDLGAADFAVKENGKAREVVQAEISKTPMQIALIVDDNGTGLFRAGVIRFIQRLQDRAVFSISTVTPQTRKLVDFTADGDRLVEAIGHLNARPGTPDGGQLLEGISEAAREFKQREARRPVIVALTVPGEEHSTILAHQVLDQLRQSSASLHVISVASSALRSTAQVQRPRDLLGENLNLHEVLGDGPKQSGGRHDEIVASAGLVSGLHTLAEQLINQYYVVYTLPQGVKPHEKISVSLKRRGLTLRAPTRVPNR